MAELHLEEVKSRQAEVHKVVEKAKATGRENHFSQQLKTLWEGVHLDSGYRRPS